MCSSGLVTRLLHGVPQPCSSLCVPRNQYFTTDEKKIPVYDDIAVALPSNRAKEMIYHRYWNKCPPPTASEEGYAWDLREWGYTDERGVHLADFSQGGYTYSLLGVTYSDLSHVSRATVKIDFSVRPNENQPPIPSSGVAFVHIQNTQDHPVRLRYTGFLPC